MRLLTLLQVLLITAPVALSTKTLAQFAKELERYKTDRHFIEICPNYEFELGLKGLYKKFYEPRKDLSIDKRLDHLIIALKGLTWEELNNVDDNMMTFQHTLESQLMNIAKKYESEKKECLNLDRYLKPLEDPLAIIKRQPNCPWEESKKLLLEAQGILSNHEREIQSRNGLPPRASDEQKLDLLKASLPRYESKWNTLDGLRVQKLQVILEKISPAFSRDREKCKDFKRFDEATEQLALFNEKVDRYMEQLKIYREKRVKHIRKPFEDKLVIVSGRVQDFEAAGPSMRDTDSMVDWGERALRQQRGKGKGYFTAPYMESILKALDNASYAFETIMDDHYS
ncbi:hypothetical protein FRC03_007114 [Tulasnella sp. 419]|nr:hypothetical protein FRC03_007114 [Tulasnella sp. 419]